jgi:hypothetical protein
MTVGEMLSKISSSELTEWIAYFKVMEEVEKPKVKTSDALKAMFANRIVRKNHGGITR